MGSKINSVIVNQPLILHKLGTFKPPPQFLACVSLSSYGIRNEQGRHISTPSSSTTSTQVKIADPSCCSIKFKTLGACKLGISRYPDFIYDAAGGTGTGLGQKMIERNTSVDDELKVSFDPETLYIPALSSETTRFLGLPLPPFLKIEIIPEFFGGYINQQTGKVDLEFLAKFCFSVGTIYRAPPLIVKTVLTSEESIGSIRRGSGERMNAQGNCRLVGVATVDPVDDFFINSFLGLPTECLADLNAVISLSS
ncbi:hypothetical protein SAY86_027261 [Trapa natans]|uniref:Uncharacterized protein n=1 Tax=Trapa natans TaxID=22666 RepID=A0AAN7QJ24_TRANT|nr:hypothetical protein SAY86_027261 [Trapa natans]